MAPLSTEAKLIDQNHIVTQQDTQRYVALDLEYNQPSGTIIQVGVAIGSAAQNQQHDLAPGKRIPC